MKTISATVFAALFAATQGRFLDATNPLTVPATNFGVTAFASTLNCGQCIGAGNTYCIQKAENTPFNGYPAANTQTCIAAGASSTQQTDSTWSCSNAFADRVYAKYTCQYNTAQCGPQTVVNLANTNSTQNVTVQNLQQGQTCFYTVKATCGGPAFQPDLSGLNYTKFEFEYVTYQDANLNTSDALVTYATTGQNSNSTTKRQGVPAAGLPRRDHYFNAGLGGNRVVNANTTLDSQYSNVTNGTIFGNSGRYDKTAGGRKLYGNLNQAAGQLSNLTNQANADCSLRSLHLAVTAVSTDSPSINVTFSSVAFYRPPAVVDTTGASFLSMTFAAVLGVVSLAFF